MIGLGVERAKHHCVEVKVFSADPTAAVTQQPPTQASNARPLSSGAGFRPAAAPAQSEKAASNARQATLGMYQVSLASANLYPECTPPNIQAGQVSADDHHCSHGRKIMRKVAQALANSPCRELQAQGAGNH